MNRARPTARAAAADLPEEVLDLPWEDDFRCGRREDDEAEEELEDA